MLRQGILQSIKPALRGKPSIHRVVQTTAIRKMAAGDTGAARPGGEASGDAFSKREKAQEDLYVRQKEREKLMALKEKLKQQRQHLDELEQHINEVTKEQGGEHN